MAFSEGYNNGTLSTQVINLTWWFTGSSCEKTVLYCILIGGRQGPSSKTEYAAAADLFIIPVIQFYSKIFRAVLKVLQVQYEKSLGIG